MSGPAGSKLIDRPAAAPSRAGAWSVGLWRLRWVPFLIAAAVCAAAWPSAREVAVDPSNTAFLIREGREWYEYERFTGVFGAEPRIIVVGAHLPAPIDTVSAAALSDWERELGRAPGVLETAGLSGAQSHRVRWFGTIESAPFLQPLLEGRESLQQLIARRSSWPPSAAPFLSADGSSVAVVLTLAEPPPGEDFSPVPTVEAVRASAARLLPPGTEISCTGTSLEQHAFSSQIDADRRTFVPLCVGVIVILLLVFHGDLRTLVYSLAVMGGALTLTEAVMAWSGARVHAVTALLAPVVLIVAVSSTVKACGIFDLTRSITDPPSRLAAALRGMFAPCFLANLTTFIGFLSLLVSRVPAVRDFGLYGAAGTAFAWGLTMLGAPLFAVWGRPRPAQAAERDPLRRVGSVIASVSRPAPWLIVIAALIGTAAAAREIPRIHTSTDLLKIFKSEDPFRSQTERFMTRMGGIYPLEVFVEAPAPSAVRAPETWDRLDAFQRAVAAWPDVSRVTGPADVVRYFEGVAGRGRSPKVLDRILAEVPAKDSRGWGRVAAAEATKMRFTLFLTTSDTRRVSELARLVEAEARRTLGDGWSVAATGKTRLLAEMSQRLVRDEAASVLTAFGVIFVLLVLTIRSARYSILGVLPNLAPIAGLFGLMAALGIGLNTATAMIASVAIGLVFDNTIYLLYGYREARRLGLDAGESVDRALRERFRPMIASSLVLAGGFGVTMFGHMVPTTQFGLLSCATIGLVTASDLLLVPALLRIFRPR